ncbi:MAG TPA: hypothetical protein VKE51_07700 [Vicinamibacterales bacterium]|nr:hypothetical protein [Vicinamibacterales bacterium]
MRQDVAAKPIADKLSTRYGEDSTIPGRRVSQFERGWQPHGEGEQMTRFQLSHVIRVLAKDAGRAPHSPNRLMCDWARASALASRAQLAWLASLIERSFATVELPGSWMGSFDSTVPFGVEPEQTIDESTAAGRRQRSTRRPARGSPGNSFS